MRGIKFNDKTSADMEVLVQVTSLPLLPEKRANRQEVEGRDGYIDYGGNSYANKIIGMTITLKAKNRQELMMKSRLLANWLAPKGVLSLSEEPNVYYVGEIFTLIDRSKSIHSVAEYPVVFDVEPYAYMVHPNSSGIYPVINSMQDLLNSNHTKVL